MSNRTKRGFTIVELLIVIVVIAILAAITVVAFAGIQERARASASQVAAKNVATKIAAFAVENSESYPATLNLMNIASSGDTNYQYRVNNTTSPKSWCATATVGDKSYYVSEAQSSPKVGACDGHGLNGNGAITNLSINPRGIHPSNAYYANDGTYHLITRNVTVPATPDGITTAAQSQLKPGQAHGAVVSVYNLDGLQNIAGKSRSVSVWVRVNVAGYAVSAVSGFPSTPLTANTWTRVSTTTPYATDAHSGIQIWKSSGTVLETDRAWMTGVMSVEGTQHYAFRDGQSPGWIWSGSLNSSSSTGSAP